MVTKHEILEGNFKIKLIVLAPYRLRGTDQSPSDASVYKYSIRIINNSV